MELRHPPPPYPYPQTPEQVSQESNNSSSTITRLKAIACEYSLTLLSLSYRNLFDLLFVHQW